MTADEENSVCLFDVDGTLSTFKAPISKSIAIMLIELSNLMDVGVVSGATYKEIKRILAPCWDNIRYVFAENGGVVYNRGLCTTRDCIKKSVENEQLEKMKSCLKISLRHFKEEISEVRQKLIENGHLDGDVEPMRFDDHILETWIEQRCNLWNVTILGKPQTRGHRHYLTKLYQTNDIRIRIRNKMRSLYGDEHIPWRIVTGGSVSIDIYPLGWDKRRCLKFLENYRSIYFFGDRCEKEGNDYELYMDPRTKAFRVSDADDTLNQVYYRIIAPSKDPSAANKPTPMIQPSSTACQPSGLPNKFLNTSSEIKPTADTFGLSDT